MKVVLSKQLIPRFMYRRLFTLVHLEREYLVLIAVSSHSHKSKKKAVIFSAHARKQNSWVCRHILGKFCIVKWSGGAMILTARAYLHRRRCCVKRKVPQQLG